MPVRRVCVRLSGRVHSARSSSGRAAPGAALPNAARTASAGVLFRAPGDASRIGRGASARHAHRSVIHRSKGLVHAWWPDLARSWCGRVCSDRRELAVRQVGLPLEPADRAGVPADHRDAHGAQRAGQPEARAVRDGHLDHGSRRHGARSTAARRRAVRPHGRSSGRVRRCEDLFLPFGGPDTVSPNVDVRPCSLCCQHFMPSSTSSWRSVDPRSPSPPPIAPYLVQTQPSFHCKRHDRALATGRPGAGLGTRCMGQLRVFLHRDSA